MLRNLLILMVLFAMGVVGAVLYYYNEIRFDVDRLINYNPEQTTEIYDRNGKKIANIFGKKNRYYVKYKDIPMKAIEALLAIEDTMYFEHPGINIDAIFRAIIKDIKAGSMVEGASTLTQQLIKNIVLTREKKLSRKIKELLLSIRLETMLSKEKILELYLNEIFFGHHYYGIKTASLGYFKKELKDLTIKEIAILVGLPKAPSYYSPTKNYEKSLERANRVLSRMHTLGWIDEERFISATSERPPVYDQTITQNVAPFVTDEVVRQIKDLIIDYKTGGYKIYTTIDLDYQEYARDSLKMAYDKAIERSKKEFELDDENLTQLNAAFISIESDTGNILALVGGIDYQKSSYNRAIQSKRQPGSAFKPFLYQVALDYGYSTVSNLIDVSRTYDYEKNGETVLWQPNNYEKNYKGLIELKEALIHSRNLATINLVTDISLKNMHRAITEYGIKDVPNDLSISLGTMGMSPLTLSKYYTLFSNNGVMVEPRLIDKIVDKYGVIAEQPKKEKFITTKEQSFLMTDILRSVVNRGTGRRARVAGLEIAGKTGTTNNFIDAWFCGYSPSIQTIIWFGNDDNTPMVKGSTGGRIAGPVFSSYYTKILKKHPEIKRSFKIPEGVKTSRINNKKVYFTETSPLPIKEIQEKEKQEAEELIF